MSEQELVMFIIVFTGGLIVGVILTLLINKIRSGSASPTAIKREMEDYQGKVEEHFDESSKKFKQITDQYADLYKHLSVGATTLCRPEKISPGLMSDQNPLLEKIDSEKQTDTQETLESNPTEPAETKTNPDAETDAKIKADLEKLKAEKLENANAKMKENPEATPDSIKSD